MDERPNIPVVPITNPPTSTTSEEPTLPERSSIKNRLLTFALTCLSFIPGIVAIGCIASVLGYTVGGTLVTHYTEYFGGLADALNIIFVGPIVFIIFGTIASIRRDWIFLLYPVIVFFFIGPIAYELDISKGIAAQLPFNIHGLGSNNQYFASTILSYEYVYIMERSLSFLFTRGRFSGTVISRSARDAHIAVLCILTIVCAVLPFVGHAMLESNKVEQVTVTMPNTSEFISFKDGTSPQGYTIYYLTPTKQYTGTYNMRDSYSATTIEQGKSTKVRDVCGSNLTVSYSAGTHAVSYDKTANGLEYGAYTVELNGTNPPRKTLAYKEYHSCFVIKGKKYDLLRSSAHGEAYMQQYPTKQIVGAFADPSSNINCHTVGKNCSKENVAATAVRGKIKVEPLGSTTVVDINPNTYRATGSLDIKEWGIKIPLTDATADAYYAAPGTNDTLLKIGLKSKSTGQCFVGSQQGSSGVGVAYIARILKSTADAQKSESITFSTPNVQIGDYLYAAYANGNATTCLGDAGAAEIEDIFNWATVTMQAL